MIKTGDKVKMSDAFKKALIENGSKEHIDEMRKLEQNMRDTHSAYVKEYMNSKQK